MLSHGWLSWCLTWYYIWLACFYRWRCNLFAIFPLLVSHGVALLVCPLFYFNPHFRKISFFGVTVKFLLLIGKKMIGFFWVHWLELLLVCLYNGHPQRFFSVDWFWLGCTFHLGYFLVHLFDFSWTTYLTGTLGGTSGGLEFLNIFARVPNASLCPFPSLTSGLAGDIFWSAQIKSCAAWKVASMEEKFGMLNCLGKNSTVSDILYALVLVMYALWHI